MRLNHDIQRTEIQRSKIISHLVFLILFFRSWIKEDQNDYYHFRFRLRLRLPPGEDNTRTARPLHYSFKLTSPLHNYLDNSLHLPRPNAKHPDS